MVIRLKKVIPIILTTCLLLSQMILSAFAWGPDRPSYTLEQVNNGALDGKIVFNSISDNPSIGQEFYFVGARELGKGNLGSDNIWYDNINVELNKIYVVRMYINNDSRLGLDAIAEDVTVTFYVPSTVGQSIEINGFVESSNASPQTIWDNAVFLSDKDFYLEYIPGSAFFENDGFSNAGVRLDDNIVTASGVLIGYDKLDGQIPGGFQYAGYISILVRPVFIDEAIIPEDSWSVNYEKEEASPNTRRITIENNYGTMTYIEKLNLFYGDSNTTIINERDPLKDIVIPILSLVIGLPAAALAIIHLRNYRKRKKKNHSRK